MKRTQRHRPPGTPARRNIAVCPHCQKPTNEGHTCGGVTR